MRSENLRFPFYSILFDLFLSVRLVRVQLTLRVGFLATGKPATTVIATSAVDVLWLNCQQIFFAIVYVKYFSPLARNIANYGFVSVIMHKVGMRLNIVQSH
jgi:hypothetical protein